jgi:plasmid replication initiation protein
MSDTDKSTQVNLAKDVGNNLVVKDNNLINASYELTLNEQRLMLGCISLIDSREEIEPKRFYKISLIDIADLTGVANSTQFYKDMVLAAKRLLKRTIKIGDKATGVYGEAVWVTKYIVDDKSRTIEINFNEDVLPYLTSLQARFTKYKLKDVAKFRSVYSIRIYELLAQWKRVGYVEIELSKLRTILCVENKYPAFSDLRKSVIEVAVNEITQHSNMDVSYGYKKQGRTIVALQFRFEHKTPETEESALIKHDKSGKLTKEYIEKNARVGESWDEAIRRLRREQ